jgi:hypothetical protein
MLTLVTPPSTPLISLADAKAHLRVTNTAEDTLIPLLVKAATTRAERYTGRRFLNQTWKIVLDGIPKRKKSDPWWDGVRDGAVSELYGDGDYIDLYLAPLSSINSMKTYDQSNVVSTFPSTEYFADSSSEPARLVKNDGSTWPVNLRTFNAVEIEAVFGYGTNPTDVPEDIIQAVKLIVGHMFENRGDSEAAERIPGLAMELLESYKVRVLG